MEARSRDNHSRFVPTDMAGYAVVETLTDDLCWLARAPGNRKVVLKRLDADCLVSGGAKLHPTIRDRLARVRELAHARIANLHGVESDPEFDGGNPYLIWEYVAGQTLQDWAGRPEVSQRDLLLVARELILTVEAMHARGIVHGAIHGRNVIIDESGRLRLTHVSPLLYTEPQNDLDSIAALFQDLAAQRGEANSPLDQLGSEAQQTTGMRALGAEASALIDSRQDEDREHAEALADRRRRSRSRGAAAVVILISLALTYALKHVAHGRWSTSPPQPPRAPAAAMSP